MAVKYAPWVLAALFLFLLVRDAGTQGELKQQIKEAKERIESRMLVIAALAKQKARVDTVKAKSKAVYVPVKATWDSLTVVLGDKIRLDPVLLIADSTIKACDRVLHDCENQVATRDTLLAQQGTVIWAQDSVIHMLERRKNSRLACVVGGGAATRGFDAGFFCGVRPF